MQGAPPAAGAELENETEFFSMEDLQNNMKIIKFCHTFMSIVAGCVAGIAGLTGMIGFLLFGAISFMTSLGLLVKMNFKLKEYSVLKMPGFILEGFSGHGLSYVLFWTLAYALVHIY